MLKNQDIPDHLKYLGYEVVQTMCPFAIQTPNQLTNCDLLKQRRNKDVIIGRCSVSQVLGAVFCLMCPWLLLHCQRSSLILPLHCCFLSFMSTYKSLLPLLPGQAALCAMASFQGEKDKERCSSLFPFLVFTQLLIFMTSRNLTYFKIPMALSS